MKYALITDNKFDHNGGGFVGQNVCTCGWRGAPFDIGEPAERAALDAEGRQHKMSHRVTNVMTALFLAMTITWLGLIGVGAAWLLKSLAGW